jgi:hypothetical protein
MGSSRLFEKKEERHMTAISRYSPRRQDVKETLPSRGRCGPQT